MKKRYAAVLLGEEDEEVDGSGDEEEEEVIYYRSVNYFDQTLICELLNKSNLWFKYLERILNLISVSNL